MTRHEEIPVNGATARQVFGWGSSYMCAVKRAMGIRSRYFFLSDVRKFIRQNPSFTSSQIYHQAHCTCGDCRVKKVKAKPMEAMTQADSTGFSIEFATPFGPVPTGIASESYSLLCGQKLKSLRGKQSIEKICKATGLSRETLRKAELGIAITLKTIRKIATATGATELERLELTALSLKAEAGEDATKFAIKIIDPYEEQIRTASMATLLVDHVSALTARQQEAVMNLIGSKQKLDGLCAIFGGPAKQDDIIAKNYGPVSPIRTPAPEHSLTVTHGEDLWASL